MEKISVIVPVLNCREHLNRIIIGLLNQTYRNLEVIVLDNGSSDLTYEMCQDWSFLDDRINVYQINSNAFDFGLEKATGKYVMLIDNLNIDDKFMLENMISSLKNNNADISIYNSNYNRITSYLVSDYKNIENDLDGCLWNKMFKKDLFNSYNKIENVFKTALKKAVRISLFV